MQNLQQAGLTRAIKGQLLCFMQHIFCVTPQVGALLLIFFSVTTRVASPTLRVISYFWEAFLSIFTLVSFVFNFINSIISLNYA